MGINAACCVGGLVDHCDAIERSADRSLTRGS